MEIIALIVIAGLVYLYIANNSRKVKDETVIKTTQTVKTANGEQTITRTTTINDVQTDIRNPNNPIVFPEHKVIQPVQTTQANQAEMPVNSQSRLTQSEPTRITHQPTQPQIQFKECSACKRTQPITEFSRNPNQPDGFTKWCKTCMVVGAPNPSDMKGKKVCEKCGQTRMKTSFYPTSKYPDGLSKWCKYCLPKRKSKK